MAEVPDKEALAAWIGFLRTHATVIRALERELQAEEGLPLTWYDVLVWLSATPDNRLSHQGLSESILLSRSSITRLVDQMVAAGLVSREASLDDRRVSYVVMTVEGRRVLERVAPGHLRGIGRYFSRYLDGEDMRALQSAWTKVLQGNVRLRVEDGDDRRSVGRS